MKRIIAVSDLVHVNTIRRNDVLVFQHSIDRVTINERSLKQGREDRTICREASEVLAESQVIRKCPSMAEADVYLYLVVVPDSA